MPPHLRPPPPMAAVRGAFASLALVLACTDVAVASAALRAPRATAPAHVLHAAPASAASSVGPHPPIKNRARRGAQIVRAAGTAAAAAVHAAPLHFSLPSIAPIRDIGATWASNVGGAIVRVLNFSQRFVGTVIKRYSAAWMAPTLFAACLAAAWKHCLVIGVGTNPFQFALVSVCLLLQLISFAASIVD